MPTPDEQNSRFLALTGFGTDYGSPEARQALANADASSGGGGGSGGSVQVDYYGSGSNSPATSIVNTNGVVGTGNTAILAADSNRVFIQIINSSSNDLFLNFNTPANANNSIKLLPNGYWSSYDPSFVTSVINASGSNAGTTYVVHYTLL